MPGPGTDPPPDTASAVDPSLSDWTGPAETPAPLGPDVAFTPGTMLADRYRIVAPLGRGGMGEVYRAEDVKLGQAVALKFVRGALSPELRQRLYDEVRIGRQIAHPSVCRLYDIVEKDGQTFLAMEYVDGEDLSSLLARIGRLPPDKALEIARDLLSGLAAIHDKGVVHRDLKPANVMVDGRGQARLTDFGLAIALESGRQGGLAGTPAYMAPEQLHGGEITPRSDLYALGLILFEMLSGQRFFSARSFAELLTQHEEAKGPRLASTAGRIDPVLEQALRQCLEEDAGARPASARAVLALLPGGDPLEAAMAAGRTPSPELVAAAGVVGDLPPVLAWSCLLVLFAAVAASALCYDRLGLLNRASLPKSPELLVDRAREVLARVGRTGPPVRDSAYGFEWDRANLDHARADPRPAAAREAPTAAFGPYYFFYRESPRALVGVNRDGTVHIEDPPLVVSGMTELILDPSGRLKSFTRVPPEVEAEGDAWPEPDFAPFFAEAGLDKTKLEAVAPRWAAPVDSDRKAAWQGLHPERPDVTLRVEAAAYHGRPVWFAVLLPWAQATHMPLAPRAVSPVPVGEVGVWILALAMPIGGLLLARRNLRLGRGDQSGARRVALLVLVVYSLARVLRAEHVASGEELWVLIRAIAYPCFWSMLVWLLYMALEPYARRRWPRVLISWQRLLAGQFRDPLVGRDVLVGGMAGGLLAVSFLATLLLPGSLAPIHIPDPYVHGDTLSALRQVYFRLFVNQYSAVLYGMVFLFMLVLLRLVLRSTWIAMPAWCILVANPFRASDPLVDWSVGVLGAAAMYLVLMRCGLLGLTIMLLFLFNLVEVPLTLDLSAWYVSHALPAVLFLGAMAVYGFRVSLGGKPAFGSLLED